MPDLPRTPACDEVEMDLSDAARIQREGGNVADHYPDLARHLEECEWCRAQLAELVKEPDLLAEAETEDVPSDRAEKELAAALFVREPAVQIPAAGRLASARRVAPATLAALAETAAGDRDEDVRKAARTALDELLTRLAPGVAELGKAGVTGTLSADEGELRVTLEGLPRSFEGSTPVVVLPGGEPGLVTPESAVSEGRLDVRLGRLLDPSAGPELSPELEGLFVVKPEAEPES